MLDRAAYADALHHAGRLDAAATHFAEAEAMLGEQQSEPTRCSMR